MKHLHPSLLTLSLFLFLTTLLFGQSKEIMTLYGGKTSSSFVWKTSEDDGTHFKYQGEIDKGVPNGLGTITSPDGREYVGEFKNGLPHGKGTTNFPDGRKYIGQFKRGQKHGQGTFTWSDGTEYIGEWKEGEQNGQGTDIFTEGRYIGEFKDGKYNGQGTLTLLEGTKYVGEFKNGFPDGQGTETSQNIRSDGTIIDGYTYEGNWKEGKFSIIGVSFSDSSGNNSIFNFSSTSLLKLSSDLPVPFIRSLVHWFLRR